MDKKTMLAIALSLVVLGLGMFIQWKLFPKVEKQPVAQENEPTQEEVKDKEQQISFNGEWNFWPVDNEDNTQVKQEIPVETDVLKVSLSSDGGRIKSFKLKNHKEKDGDLVEMIIDPENTEGAFFTNFGNHDQAWNRDSYQYSFDEKTKKHIFSKQYRAENKETGESIEFECLKEYKFFPDEYLFELTVSLKTKNGEPLPFSKDKALYTLQFGPQLGPEFEKLSKGKSRIGDHRSFLGYILKKKKTISIPKKQTEKTVTDRYSWTGINGKYFSLVIIPGSAEYAFTYSTAAVNQLQQSNQIFLSRKPEAKASIEDKYRIYMGPNLKRELDRYNDAEKNGSGLMDTGMDKLVEGGFLGWLEYILMKLLIIFYKIIPNYGIAIILLTVLIKIVLFPFTWKSFESTTKLQALQPKIQELQAKFKEDPAKMNQEMADLYKREGVNPMGGCLPQLLQMPVLIALYGLLNRYFDLRGAAFIPGWIEDLSSPESIMSFGFTLPLVDIGELRLLPIIYLIIQFLTSFVMQGSNPAAAGSSNAQMKMMTYGMPLIFFFLFYNMPSGLLLYWTMTNVLTLIQQLVTNRIKKYRKG